MIPAVFEKLKQVHGWSLEDHLQLSDQIWVPGNHTCDLSYPEEGHDVLSKVEASSYWFNHRNRVIGHFFDRFIKQPEFWEIGSGNGFVCQYLMSKGVEVVGVEPGHSGAVKAAERGVTSVCALFSDLRLPSSCIANVGCFDVLEHLETPGELVEDIHDKLQPGGYFMVTVPALSWLWSASDHVAGHYRRYSRGSLKRLMQAHGFDVMCCRYMMGSMVPYVFLLRRLPYLLSGGKYESRAIDDDAKQLKPEGGVINKALALQLSMELQYSKVIPSLAGSSVIGVFRKAG